MIYNGAAPWRAAQEVSELVEPAEGELASCRPSQGYRLLDERNGQEDDLPDGNLVTAVIRLERIRSLSDLIEVTGTLRAWLRRPEDDGLERAFAGWVREIAQRIVPAGTRLEPEMALEDVRMTLVERVGEWPKEWVREGLEQGLGHERALLRRQAASRFGASAAERLLEVLADISDPERLAEVGEWLVRCDTGGELLARAESARRAPHGGSNGDRP